MHIEINNWWIPANGSIGNYTIKLSSPDMKNEEEYTLTAPNAEWAIIQAVAVAFYGEPFDPTTIDIDDDSRPGLLDELLERFPDNLSVNVDGQPVPDYQQRLRQRLHGDFGLLITFGDRD